MALEKVATDSSLSESWSPGIPEGKLVDVVGGVTQPGASPHLMQPHALSFFCSVSPLCFPNEAGFSAFCLHVLTAPPPKLLPAGGALQGADGPASSSDTGILGFPLC